MGDSDKGVEDDREEVEDGGEGVEDDGEELDNGVEEVEDNGSGFIHDGGRRVI